MIGADSFRILDQAQPARGVRLRIAIDQQRINLRCCNGRGQIDGSRSLAHAALLIGNRDDASHLVFGESERRLQNRPSRCPFAMTDFSAARICEAFVATRTSYKSKKTFFPQRGPGRPPPSRRESFKGISE